MKKRLCILTSVLGLLPAVYALAQTMISTTNSNTMQTIRIYDPFLTRYTAIDGSPYLPADSMQAGWLVMNAKKIPTKLRYNMQTGDVEYLEGNKVVTPVNPVSGFVIVAADTLRFKKGFPTIGSRTANDFYQVLYDGRRSKLVRHIHTEIKTGTDVMQSDYGKQRFQQRDEYYVWTPTVQPPTENYFEKLSEGQMRSIVANKKSLTTLFPNSGDAIEKYLSEQKLKLKSWTEFAKVLRFLETQ